MRYTVVCTSMLSDHIEGLEEKVEESMKRMEALEGAVGSLMEHQDQLNNKVVLLMFNFDLNLKHHFQVVDSEVKILMFSLNKLVLIHQDWTQQNTSSRSNLGSTKIRFQA